MTTMIEIKNKYDACLLKAAQNLDTNFDIYKNTFTNIFQNEVCTGIRYSLNTDGINNISELREDIGSTKFFASGSPVCESALDFLELRMSSESKICQYDMNTEVSGCVSNLFDGSCLALT